MTYRFAQSTNNSEISLIRRMNNLVTANTINLGIGQLPYSLPIQVIDAGKTFLSRGKIGYTPNAGLPELRELIANEYQSRTEKPTCRDEVLVCAGVEHALYVAFSTFLDKGDEVLIPEISFSPYRTIPKRKGAVVREFKLDKNFMPDFSDLEKKIIDKTKLIVVNSPANPTGAVLDNNSLEKLARILKRNPGVMLLSDEIYSNLYFSATRPVSPARYTNQVIVLDGISKSHGCGTGLRLGYVVADEEIINRMTPIVQETISCAPTLSQVMAMPIFRGECKDHELSVRANLQANRGLLLERLDSIPSIKTTIPEGAFYCFVDVSSYKSPETPDSESIAKKILKEKDVLVIPGIAFGKAGDDFIRISYAVPRENILNGTAKLNEAFRKWNQKI
ncbi:MAG: pyridoxal phosphate-dependent aminotransferase [Nanoarchaeota archaeon]